MVVDASVVSTAVVETTGPAAQALARSSALAAPGLLDLEVIQTIRKKVQAGALTQAAGAEAVNRLKRLPIARHPHAALVDRIWALRGNLTAYDASYVALAERLRVSLLTADGAFATAPGIHCPVELVEL
jgi:predicted nucleic acid-binding protein